jgi:RNA-splicing ligase RtcB
LRRSLKSYGAVARAGHEPVGGPAERHRQGPGSARGVWYDYRHADELRDEAPAAYKDIRAVLRAQHDLVKVTRTLRPILNHKAA